MKFIAALILPALLFAQPTKVTRVIEYEPDGTDQMKRFEPLMAFLDVGMRTEPLLRLVSLQGPNKESVDEAERLIRQYYKPRPAKTAPDRNVELTLYVLAGKSGTDPSAIPSVLIPVAAQLRQSTSLTSFREVETQILRIRPGTKTATSGALTSFGSESATPSYEFSANVNVLDAKVRVDNMLFRARILFSTGGGQLQNREVRIDTSLDLTPGQLVVVGKANALEKDGAIILILSAKIVE